MKDTIISSYRKKVEIYFLIISFVLANLLNVCAIIRYKSSWGELWSMFGYVLVISVALYFVTVFARLIYYFFVSMHKRLRRKS